MSLSSMPQIGRSGYFVIEIYSSAVSSPEFTKSLAVFSLTSASGKLDTLDVSTSPSAPSEQTRFMP